MREDRVGVIICTIPSYLAGIKEVDVIIQDQSDLAKKITEIFWVLFVRLWKVETLWDQLHNFQIRW